MFAGIAHAMSLWAQELQIVHYGCATLNRGRRQASMARHQRAQYFLNQRTFCPLATSMIEPSVKLIR